MKKNLIIFLICLLIGLFTVLPAGALTISGHVEYGSPVVVTLSGDASIVTVTDRSGNYEFTDLAPGGTYTITPSRDYTPPNVDITYPETNSLVTGSVTIAANVRTDYCAYGFDPASITITNLDRDMENQDFQVMLTSCCFIITNVEFYIDDNLLYSFPTSSDMCEAEYTYPWDTTAFSDDQHIIKVTVTDDNSGTGSAEIPVTVNNNTSMPLLGDVNLDGSIDIVDALSTARYFVGLDPPVFDAPLADVNLDDEVNILDALLIAQYYVGLITELPEQKPGGYTQIPASSENALAAYDFLEIELLTSQPDITLGDTRVAFSQVVAGINVRLVCDYYSPMTGDSYLSAVIFLNLDMVPEEVVSLNLDIY